MPILVVVLFLLGACSHPTTLGKDTGQSAQTAIELQTFDPAASRNLSPVTGLDSHAAAIIIDQYRKSFDRGEKGVAEVSGSGITTTTKTTVLTGEGK
jgi:hypothetical protein